MSGPLPPDAQPGDGPADRPVADGDLMALSQVSAQQRCGPDRRAITEGTRVRVYARGDQRLAGPTAGPRASRTRGIAETVPQVEPGPLPESAHPVVNRLAADMEEVGDPFDRLALGEPKEGLSTTALPGRRGAEDRAFQFDSLPVGQEDRGHRTTPAAIAVSR